MVWSEEEGRLNKMKQEPICETNEMNDPSLSSEIDKKEKEIVRIIRIAEKDKKDSMLYTQRIRKLNEQYKSLSHSDLFDESVFNDNNMDNNVCSTSLPASPRKGTMVCEDENHSPNIGKSPCSAPTGNEFHQFERLIKNKDEELLRVSVRAAEEAQRAASLKKREEEIQQMLSRETEKWQKMNTDLRQEIDRKEKSIVRLTILAEQDKKKGMLMREQISKLKKSLEGFISVRPDAKSEQLQQIIVGCVDDLASSPIPSSYLLSPKESLVQSPFTSCPLREEVDSLMRENNKKDCELARVQAIADSERQNANSLKDKVEEMKKALVGEFEVADRELELKVREIRIKQEAIQKVSARAARERSRSNILLDEIIKLTHAIAQESSDAGPKREMKKSEYGPDTAYLAEFSELADLDGKPAQVPISPVNDPVELMSSPPCKSIHLSLDKGSGSECEIFKQKMKDLELLEKEKAKKDEELAKLKRLAEAERCRHLLLKDKMQELRNELADVRLDNRRTL